MPPTGCPENGPIYLVKENNVTSEQTFQVIIQVTDSAPSGTAIQSATIDQDYQYAGADRRSQSIFFRPFDQRVLVSFELLADTLPEGTEAFQASVSPEVGSQMFLDGRMERFPISLNPINLASEIFITIIDNAGCKFQMHACSVLSCTNFFLLHAYSYYNWIHKHKLHC